MTRVLKNSKVNPRKVDEDDAFNRAVNRGEDKRQREKVTQIANQPKTRMGDSNITRNAPK